MKNDKISNLPSRLKEILEIKKINQKELSELSGIRASSISDWINNKYEAKQDKIYMLSKALDVSPAWLMGFDVDIDNHKKNEVTFIGRANVMKTYRYIDDKASAGQPIPIDGKQHYSSLSVPDSMLGKYANEDILFMHIVGDSMDKVIPDGSLIGILEFNSNLDIKNGDIVVFNNNYNYSVKRYYKDENKNRIIFKPESENPIYTDIIYDLEYENVNIIGKVIMYNVTLD